jgi:hypothetical protein
MDDPGELSSNRTDFERMFDAEAPDYARDMTQSDVDLCMDEIGWDTILEEIARGNTRNALALRYHVPIIKFHRWLNARVTDKSLMDEALRLCAESMMVKSHMALQQDATDATQAGMMKAFSKQISDIAAAIAPQDWSPRKPADDGGSSSGQVVINIGGGADIPGTNLLGHGVTVDAKEAKKADGAD